MDIRAVHGYLANTLLKGLAITQPRAATIKRVYRYLPAMNQAITDFPCAMLTYVQDEVRYHPALLHKRFTVELRVVTGEAAVDGDVAADMAAAFNDAIILAISGDLTLGGTVTTVTSLRGREPETLTLWEWAGKGFIGCGLFLEIQMSEARQHLA